MMKKGRAYSLGVLATVVVAVALIAWMLGVKPVVTLVGKKIDPLSGPFVLDAIGCEIYGADGHSIKEAVRQQGTAEGKALLPAGTTLNGACFPAANAASPIQLK